MQTYALLETLRRASLLSPEQLAEAARLAPTMPSSSALCDDLVARGWLTAFQSGELLAGRGHALLFGPYVLLEKIGAGGMGEVYRARHQVMSREVALKRILPGRLDAGGAVDRFRREVKAASLLDHPNVVKVLDAGEFDGLHFMVMELIRGVDLGKYLERRGRLPVVEAIDYVRQACEGMQHAHEQGLVHRDLKPSNLMLTQQRVVKIMDMGLALVADASTLTHAGASSFGTVDYMAPEQVIDSHKVDVRADVYSLGCTLYHLLAGQTPFHETHPAARPSMHISQEPQPIEQRRPEVPMRLAAVLRKMMAKKREHRYATPGEAAAVLGAIDANPVTEPLPAPQQQQQARPASSPGWQQPPPPPARSRAVDAERLPEVVEIARAETRPSSRRTYSETEPDRPSPRSGRDRPSGDSGRFRGEEWRPDPREEALMQLAGTWATRLAIVALIYGGLHLLAIVLALGSLVVLSNSASLGGGIMTATYGMCGMLLSCTGLVGFLGARSLRQRKSPGWVRTTGALAIVGGVIASLVALFGGGLGGLLLLGALVMSADREPVPAGMVMFSVTLTVSALMAVPFLITAFIAGAKVLSVMGQPGVRRSFER